MSMAAISGLIDNTNFLSHQKPPSCPPFGYCNRTHVPATTWRMLRTAFTIVITAGIFCRSEVFILVVIVPWGRWLQHCPSCSHSTHIGWHYHVFCRHSRHIIGTTGWRRTSVAVCTDRQLPALCFSTNGSNNVSASWNRRNSSAHCILVFCTGEPHILNTSMLSSFRVECASVQLNDQYNNTRHKWIACWRR